MSSKPPLHLPRGTAATVAVTCQACGGTVWLPPSRAQGRKYCSRDCFHLALRAGAARLRRPRTFRSAHTRERALANLRAGPFGTRLWWEDRAHAWYRCTQCGAAFPSRATTAPRYCSQTCAQLARYQAVPTPCVICGSSFLNSQEPDHQRQTCSRSCGARLCWITRRSGPPHS